MNRTLTVHNYIIRDRKKSFENFFRIMCHRGRISPGFQESIAKKIFSKIDRKNGLNYLFQIWSIYCPIETKIEISSLNHFFDRFSKNFFLQSIPESLEKFTPEGA